MFNYKNRLSTKNPEPNVAVRRREFELIAENSDWRKGKY